MTLRILSMMLLLTLCNACEEGQNASSASTANEQASITTKWYLDMHGGNENPRTNTVIGLTDGGDATILVPIKRTIPKMMEIQEPRGMHLLDDGRMMLVSSKQDHSAIMIFGMPNWEGRRAFLDVLVLRNEHNPLLVHPYDLAVDSDGTVLVSCQDSSCVLRYKGPLTTTPGEPVTAWSDVGPGCWVPPDTHAEHGLKSPRGIAFGWDDHLYVADREKGVSAWDSRGQFVRTIADQTSGVIKPVQILFDSKQRLFIGDSGAHTVWIMESPHSKPRKFIDEDLERIEHPSALAVDENWLYVGDRSLREVTRYRLTDGSPDEQVWLGDLPDSPEFLLRIDSVKSK